MSDIVEQHWPYDGPHSEETVERAAEAIAHLMRYMANALWTVRPSGPSLRRILSPLVSAEHRLDEVLDKVSVAATRLMDDPTLYDDRRDRLASQTAGELVACVFDARDRLAAGRAELELAYAAAYHLGHDTEPDHDQDGA